MTDPHSWGSRTGWAAVAQEEEEVHSSVDLLANPFLSAANGQRT